MTGDMKNAGGEKAAGIDAPGKNTGGFSIKNLVFLLLALVLFVISINLRKNISPFFLNPSTIEFSALHLFYAYPPRQ